jgi:ATP synthase protein I
VGGNREEQRFKRQVEEDRRRKIRALDKRKRSLWFGLGMLGIIGWSVSLPLLLGVGAGIWVDAKVQSPYSWSLVGLGGGLVCGLLNAWYWVRKEQGEIEREREREEFSDEHDS